MNVYECNGTNIFIRWKMKCSIQRGEAELNGTFHLSPKENISSIARMKKHSLFVLYNTKIDPCHLTSGTHCTLSFSLLLQFHQYPTFKQSRVQPSQNFSNSESNKVCLRFTKYVQGKTFAFSDISCLDELANAIHSDLWLPNLAVMTEFGTAYGIIDLRPDFVSNCTKKKPSDCDLYSLVFLIHDFPRISIIILMWNTAQERSIMRFKTPP